MMMVFLVVFGAPCPRLHVLDDDMVGCDVDNACPSWAHALLVEEVGEVN